MALTSESSHKRIFGITTACIGARLFDTRAAYLPQPALLPMPLELVYPPAAYFRILLVIHLDMYNNNTVTTANKKLNKHQITFFQQDIYKVFNF